LVDACSNLVKIRSEPLGFDFSDEDFGKVRLGRRPSFRCFGGLGIVNGECGFIQVPFKLEACRLDELFVFGIVRNGGQLTDGLQRPQPLKIDVEEAIGSGQEPSCLGRRAPPELDSRHQGGGDQKNSQEDR
jgi:hypothetical protein